MEIQGSSVPRSLFDQPDTIAPKHSIFSNWKTAAAFVALLASTSLQANETVTYTYDELGRLVKTVQSGTINDGVETDIDYDDAGNRTSYDVTGSTGTGTDDGATGVPGAGAGEAPPSFSAGNASAQEGGTLNFTVTQSAAKTGSYSVNWNTQDITTSGAQDYIAESNVLTFAPGETNRTIAISTVDDNLFEHTETFSLNLTGASGGATITAATGTGTITNDSDYPNTAPNAVDDIDPSKNTVKICEAVNIDVVANDDDDADDPPDTPLTVVAVSAVNPQTQGTASVVDANTVSFSANLTTGGAQFSYTVEDSRGAQSQALVAITIINGQGCV